MPLVIVAVLLMSALVATGEAEAEAGTHILESDGPMVSSYGPTVVADYSASMAHYRTSLRAHSGNGGLVGDFVSSLRIPWTWRSDDGSTVRRLGNSLFLLTEGDCLSRMCREIPCKQTEWPVFDCRDGHKRKMAAPGLTGISFGGVNYSQIGGPQF